MKKFLEDPHIDKIVKIFLVILVLYLLIIFLKWNRLPPEIPLFYSLPRSTEQLGSPVQLLILPFLSILIFLGHFILANIVFSQEKLLAKILLIESLVTCSVLLITFAKIVFLIS